ncbi:MAG: hypothetical protein LBE75_03155 [Burkholderiales bacterium]|jgi:hypothetical protein|nr:hypothetical protein [Burkholderiales bacterium]
MLTLKKIAVAAASAEKSAIAKTSVGAIGTWITTHEIQFVVGVATLIFMVMQIITMIPKVRAALRHMQWERERKKAMEAMCFGRISIAGVPKKKETLLEKIRRFFRVDSKKL